MMSSVIPARLQFQCGHAALVTLPRVKGETATQRNDSVAREKSAALVRQCDFCAPAVEVAVNGNHIATTDALVAEPIETLAVVVAAAEPEPEPEPETEAVAEVVELIEEAVMELVEEAIAEVVEALDEPVAEPELIVVDEPLAVVDTVVVVETPLATTNGHSTHTPPARSARKRRAPAVNASNGYTFVVEYRDERILRAVDIHDALRQVATLGAAEVTAITRED